MQVLSLRALRSIAFGVAGLVLAYVIGFVVSGFQNVFALAAVFVLVTTAAMLGWFKRTGPWGQVPPS